MPERLDLDLEIPQGPAPRQERIVGRVQLLKGSWVVFGKSLIPGPVENYDTLQMMDTDTYELVENQFGFWLRLIQNYDI